MYEPRVKGTVSPVASPEGASPEGRRRAPSSARSPVATLNPLFRRAVLVPPLLLLGCGMPVEVVRIDHPNTPVEGVRYLLKVPKFQPYLQYADGELKFYLGQTLEEEALEYELRPFGRACSETNFEVALDAKGFLLSTKAGETDRTAEILAGVAGVAVGAATLAAGARKGTPSAGDPVADLNAHIRRQKEIEATVAHVASKMSQVRQAIWDAANASGAQDLCARLEALKAEKAGLEAEKAANRFPLDATLCTVRLAGRSEPAYGDTAPNKWVVVTLDP